MKKHWLALLVAAIALAAPASAYAQGGPPPSINCNKYFQVAQGAVALTKIISGIQNQNISICGVAINNGAVATTFSMSYGTGANCATGTTTVYPVVTLGVNQSYIDHVPFANIGIPSQNTAATPVPIDVCIVTTGAGPTGIVVYYAQF